MRKCPQHAVDSSALNHLRAHETLKKNLNLFTARKKNKFKLRYNTNICHLLMYVRCVHLGEIFIRFSSLKELLNFLLNITLSFFFFCFCFLPRTRSIIRSSTAAHLSTFLLFGNTNIVVIN